MHYFLVESRGGQQVQRANGDDGVAVQKTFVQTIAGCCRSCLVLNDEFFKSISVSLRRVVFVVLMNGLKGALSVARSEGCSFAIASGWYAIRIAHGIDSDVLQFTYRSPSTLGLRIYGSDGLERRSTIEAHRSNSPIQDEVTHRGNGDDGVAVQKTFTQTIGSGFCRSCLVLNDEFFKSTGVSLGSDVLVELLNGLCYNVAVSCQGGSLTLTRGWFAIRIAHGIGTGDVLQFTYRSTSTIGLRIYGSNGLEKRSTTEAQGDNTHIEDHATHLDSDVERDHDLAPTTHQSDSRNCPIEAVEFYLDSNVVLTNELASAIDAIGHHNLASYICCLSVMEVREGCMYFSKEYTSRVFRNGDIRIFFGTPGIFERHDIRIELCDDGFARVTSGWKEFLKCCKKWMVSDAPRKCLGPAVCNYAHNRGKQFHIHGQ